MAKPLPVAAALTPTVSIILPVSTTHLPMPPTDFREAIPPVSFGPVPSLDVAIPSFDSYLPSSHPASLSGEMPADTRADTLARDPHAPTDAKRPSLTPTGCPRSNESAPAQTLSGNGDQTSKNEVEYLRHDDTDTHRPIDSNDNRRSPRSRARHARNVRPENVPSGLSVGELWATVPKHVQTLLSLERMEEEQEVAQFSYKRPFQEKRRELIERLLDPILSLEDTARLLNVCPTTVRRYTNKGILTYYRKEPERSTRSETDAGNPIKETRQRRFRLSDILAFLETQQSALEEDRQREQHGTPTPRRRRVNSGWPSDVSTSPSSEDTVPNNGFQTTDGI